MHKPKLLIFASGSTEGGGSGFENLVIASRSGILSADIVGVVSNNENGGVKVRAEKLGIPFIYFEKPWDGEMYQKIALDSDADFFALSGWLKLVRGLDPNTSFNARTVFNIHPGPLPRFGGPGLYGKHVHEAVLKAYKDGEISHTAFCMHFVTEAYDRGPIFFTCKSRINVEDTAETIGARVNHLEHIHQPRITNMVVNGQISWDGVDPKSLKLPQGYNIECFE